jgi:hypothetical protein
MWQGWRNVLQSMFLESQVMQRKNEDSHCKTWEMCRLVYTLLAFEVDNEFHVIITVHVFFKEILHPDKLS